MTNKRPVTIEEIEEIAKGELLEIPHWRDGETMFVRVRKIDVTPHLLEAGAIPNELNQKAVEAFEGKNPAMINQNINFDLNKIVPKLDAFAKEALVEPTYEEIQSRLPLTLAQKMAIFDYLLSEVRGLKSFRRQSRRHITSHHHGKNVGKKTK